MKKEGHYLKPNVVIEPLIDRWYAWSHLVSPATAAMNIQGRHLKIIDSYLQAPQIHAAAVKNPKMLGGPFMDIPVDKKSEVATLKNDTVAQNESSLELAQAIKELTHMLKHEAKGFSLEELYDKVPEALKGYVELTYDLENQPSFRIFEPLLYNSPYYREEAQSIAMWVTENDERPFVLSTPKVNTPEVLFLDIPFNHSFIDAISKMKREPGSVEEVMKMVEMTPEQEEQFRQFFTKTPPPPYEPYTGDKIRMRCFGHACILIETKEVSILADPLISYYGYDSEVDRFSDMDLPDQIDYVVVTHNHQDHILFETLLPLRHKIKNVIVPRTTAGTLQDPSLKLMFERIGFDNVIEIGDLESINFKDCTITGVPFIGEHSDLNIHSKMCYHVQSGDFKVMFMADSCNVENKLYEHVQAMIGDIDVLLLGMECDGAPLSWLYGPLLAQDLPREMDQSRRLAGSNYERGMNLVRTFNPKEVYVYAMGLEPWLEFISSIRYDETSHPIVASDQLIEESKSMGVLAERLFGEKELLYQKVLA